MQGGGQRHHRIRFERRAVTDDGAGNVLGDWGPLVTVWCGVDTQRKGRGETLEAGRLQSSVAWKVTVLKSADTAGLTPEDRGVFTAGPHAGSVVNIRVVEVSADNREIILDVEKGVAT